MHREAEWMRGAHGSWRDDRDATIGLRDLQRVIAGTQEPGDAGVGGENERAYLRHGARRGDPPLVDGAEPRQWREVKAAYERALFGLAGLQNAPEPFLRSRYVFLDLDVDAHGGEARGDLRRSWHAQRL